jgi:hypothetical protein
VGNVTSEQVAERDSAATGRRVLEANERLTDWIARIASENPS